VTLVRLPIGVKTASEQLKQMNEIYASIKEWLSSPHIDLATRRDIAENTHLAAGGTGSGDSLVTFF
jgi:hypothetical protein